MGFMRTVAAIGLAAFTAGALLSLSVLPAKTQSPDETIGASTKNAVGLSQDEIKALRTKLMSLWNPPTGISANPDQYIVSIRIRLARDHRLVGQPEVLSSGDGPLFEATRDSAVRAVFQAQPYDMLSLTTYDQWKEIVITFDPRVVYTEDARAEANKSVFTTARDYFQRITLNINVTKTTFFAGIGALLLISISFLGITLRRKYGDRTATSLEPDVPISVAKKPSDGELVHKVHDHKTCPTCHNEMSPDTTFCPNCAAAIGATAKPAPLKA
jgi:hypothetical protein